MKSAEYRYFQAYKAWKAAHNDKFKDYWWSVMEHFRKEFN